MKPAPFDYIAATSVEMAAASLAEAGDDAKIIAGGQSLVPLLNFRLLRPSILVDINCIDSLAFIREAATDIRVGALTRHYQLETSPVIARHLPVLSCAMTHVAHLAIRNRGTIGGSLAHGDPAAELPMMALLLDAELHIASVSGTRTIAARDFFLDALTVDLAVGEIITEVVLRKLPPQTGWGFAEVARRHGDFALAAVAATLTVAADVIVEARIALTGVGRTALRGAEAESLLVGQALTVAADVIVEARIALTGVGRTALRGAEAESLLVGQSLTPNVSSQAVEAVRAAIEPETDLHASADYRRHLAGVLTGRALAAAWRRAQESAT